MIYCLEKRHTFGNGSMSTHWEVIEYSHRTAIGILANGKTLKSGTKPQCERFIRLKGFKIET